MGELTSSINGTTTPQVAVAADVLRERVRQDAKWSQQNHPDGTGGPGREAYAKLVRRACDIAFASGHGTWSDILREEVAEAMAESDEAALRAELVQVAAVAAGWVEAIDRRAPAPVSPETNHAEEVGGDA